MFTRPYSIYIDKRPMRIAFLVNPESTSLEEIDQIIDYNRSLWGGRFNPIILTDGHTIDDKWWQFLRDINPDVIKPLVPLDIELIEKIENFLSPLAIEPFREDQQSTLSTQISTSCAAVGINFNSLNTFMFETSYQGLWHEDPMLGIFNLEEMSDDIGRRFILRNFGTYKPSVISYQENFVIPRTLESTLRAGEVPQEVRDAFKKGGIPFSEEAFIKESKNQPGAWAIMDREYRRIHYISRASFGLIILPDTQSFNGPLSGVNKRVFLVIDRESLADTLLELAQSRDVVFYNQVSALPNTERDVNSPSNNYFDVIIGNTIQDIIYSWNCPLLVGRRKRGGISHIWLPTELAYDPNMQEALCAWFRRVTFLRGDNPEKLRFVSYSTEERELHDIAERFSENLRASTLVERFQEPQIPNFRAENSFFTHIGEGMDIHRAQGNEEILELAEPKGLAPHDGNGHWMADFYIEFISDRYSNQEEIGMTATPSLYWRLPNRNHLAFDMFDKPSRIRRDGFPSVMMQIGENVLRLRLSDVDSVVASLFCRANYPARESDPRTQLAAAPYYLAETSDKGKYLHGVLELFGSLSYACTVLRNAYWRSIFDALSKNINAEQHAHESIANKVTKWIRREGVLTGETSDAIKSLAAFIVDESKKLTLKQREFSFDKFMQVAKCFWKKEKEHISESDHASEMTMFDFGFGEEDVKRKLARLTQQNIVQIGVKPRCPNCGMVHWYHVDDIGQHVTCQGCRNQFPLHPELTWHYRLNSLIHAAHALHGITPAVLVLGQLLEESKTSFLFSSSLNLLTFTQDESSERWEKAAEVDIACIQDGKFIIGEVKQSRGLFKLRDFDSMAAIAKRAKPDIVLFSCIDSQLPTRFISKHIERIKTELSPLEIDVKWYELEYLDYVHGV